MSPNTKQKGNTGQALLTALVADQHGDIFELGGYAAAGRAGSSLMVLDGAQTISMPYGSELMYLPDRQPILFNIKKRKFETIEENPFKPGEPIFPVAVFNSPGYVISYTCAFKEKKTASHLPLFSYGAVGWEPGGFRSAAIMVDREKRQDLRRMKIEKVMDGIREMQRRMPDNRLRKHLEHCALDYGCPAAKNFFLGRYEAPLPTAGGCNARCLGCLSRQETAEVPVSQKRITFTPLPEEIADIALTHIHRVKRAIVSFGQGCEGDPLMAAHVIEQAIRKIRSKTHKGTIHMNTNGSKPKMLMRLIEAGLDSVRISMNSVRKPYYDAYFRPVGYSFSDVQKSIELSLAHERFVSINYLNCPGFTDSPEEFDALIGFLKQYPVHMIQWRNLNFDPLRYWQLMEKIGTCGPPVGMANLMEQIRSRFPQIRYGYFNPPKETFRPRQNRSPRVKQHQKVGRHV
ncbi:MAG: radical SAM protein [Deltaproteobacteria bacterium]|nr:radical SAM protein [Deltaproteobacteria bacterium]